MGRRSLLVERRARAASEAIGEGVAQVVEADAAVAASSVAKCSFISSTRTIRLQGGLEHVVLRFNAAGLDFGSRIQRISRSDEGDSTCLCVHGAGVEPRARHLAIRACEVSWEENS